MIVLCAQGQVDKLSVVTYPLIRLARGARDVCTPRGVVASTTGGARCRTGNAVLIVVTTRVTLVVTAGGEVPGLACCLLARAIAHVSRRTRDARCARPLCAARRVGTNLARRALIRLFPRVLAVITALVAARLATIGIETW